MTRKHFETIAISIGWSMRASEPGSIGWNAILDTAATIASDLRTVNPRFDRDRFVEFVLDVAECRRDLEGKRTKGAA